jgi:SAM-dependent methyltransferase
LSAAGRVDAAAPQPIGSPPQIFHNVLARLGEGDVKRVLDAPAGRGALVQLLLDAGYDVSACDIRPDLFEVPGVECRAGNLNDRLPFEDGSFDAVTSCNGLHRVWALGHAVAEYARLLRPGGRLLITLPNFSAIKRRVRFLFLGTESRAVARSGGQLERSEGSFRQPIGLAQLLTAIEAAGLELSFLEGVWSRPERRRPGRALYWPLILTIRLATAFVRGKTRRRYRLRHVNSIPALFSDFVVIEARKPDDAR